MPIRPLATALAVLTGLGSAIAATEVRADTALLLVNDRYSNAQNLRQASEIERLRGDLSAAGFDVITVADGDGDDLRRGLERLMNADEEDRVLVAAVGHFARSNSDSWLLGSDVDEPNLATVSGDGLPLSVLMDVAATAPGRSIVLLGLERRRIDLGAGLGVGVGRVDAPQGVTVLAGAPDDLADFTTETLLVPGADLEAALSSSRGLRAFGFVSSELPFFPAATPSAPAPTQPPTSPQLNQPGAEEIALWEAAEELDTVGAYRAYLNRYPNGFYAADARAQIDTFENDPTAVAQAAEEALNLTRQQRQQIQRSLSILDYDTRGIDGIFGSGTRNAIRGWQNARGFVVTGYLDTAQINALSQQASVRAAELEEEARQAREEAERADRAYWQVTGQGATEEGLRAYLERYPDGLFAEQAEARVEEIDRARRAEAEARDRAAWDVARAQNSVAAYRAYINDNPNGAFVDQARAQIDILTGQGGGFTPQQIAQFEAREASLNLPPVTRSLIEQRLAALGLEPGRVDGRFDERSRRAIRRYQRARGITVTGYLDQQSVVRLLAETVGGILRLDGVIE
ncbi:peptidoglycan-binding domain-containing protein [Hasllibacter sp. MH4015]|uniref:peptidoglycan-binding domain-containing protein n=1 Tax=Hasllibacter sp. MH4015 TaxID=2854029 RepID=UPI001CD76D0A|nr:peptidoglycan-binding domain-containing protein [Hasllibacter sp. MH4015]